MKNRVSFAIITVLSFVLLNGCSSGPKEKEPVRIDNKEMAKELADAPKWVLDPSLQDDIAAVGSARIGQAGLQFARNEAKANARDELARILGTKVKNLINNFTEVTGIGDAETVDKVSSQVTKQVADQMVSGSRQTNMWISPSKNIYVLVSMDADSAAEAVKKAAQSSYKNDNALWQKFQAQNANKKLDAEIEKEMSR